MIFFITDTPFCVLKADFKYVIYKEKRNPWHYEMKNFFDFFFFVFADVGKLNKKADNCKNAEHMPGE